MKIKLSEMKRYLIKEQGYDEKEIKHMSLEEIYDLYTMYNEED